MVMAASCPSTGDSPVLGKQQDQTLTTGSVSAAVPSLVWAHCCLPIAVSYIVLIFVKLWFRCCAKKSKHILALCSYVSVDFVLYMCMWALCQHHYEECKKHWKSEIYQYTGINHCLSGKLNLLLQYFREDISGYYELNACFYYQWKIKLYTCS